MSTPAIQIEQLVKIFQRPLPALRKLLRRPGASHVVALNGVDLTIEQGEIFGLVGRNGQGKTTLVKTVASLVEPTSGRTRVFGYDSVQQNDKVKQRIGLVTSDERSFYWRLNGRQNLMFFSRLLGLTTRQAKRRIDDLLDTFELTELALRPFHEFSTGNRQRLALVRALLADPPLLLLDEPTRSLDPIAAEEFRHQIRHDLNEVSGKTVFVTSHNLEEIEQICHRVAIISRGRIKACAPMDELREAFSGLEHIVIHARNMAAENGLRKLRGTIPSLKWETQSEQLTRIAFSQKHADGTLHRVLKDLMNGGAEIVSCETERSGLKQIMEQVEEADS